MPRHIESSIQKHAVRWFCYNHPDKVLYANPNGGKRSRIEAAIMQGEGVLAGVPDLFLAYPVNGKPGAYFEMKSPSGELTDKQRGVITRLRAAGYRVYVCRSTDEFITAVEKYLNE